MAATATAKRSAPVHGLFFVIGDGREWTETIVGDALQARAKAVKGSRDALNAAIDNEPRIGVDGFRRASIAPVARLVGPVCGALARGNDKLGAAVLRVWAEDNADLAAAVRERLEEQSVAEDYDPKRETIESLWPMSQCFQERDAFMEQHPDDGFNGNDAALMLCLLSGRFPESETRIRSSLFTEWLEKLQSLPPDAPEWDESAKFLLAAHVIARKTVEDRNAALTGLLGKLLDAATESFADEMQYLGVDVSSWVEEASAKPGVLADAANLVERLGDTLNEYSEVRPQASTRDEELRRAGKRQEYEADILKLVEEWGELMSAPDDALVLPGLAPDSKDDEEESGVSAEDYAALESEKNDLAADRDRASQALDALRQTYEKLRAEKDALAAEGSRAAQARDALQVSYDKLRAEKEVQSDEISDLKQELFESRQREETWRNAAVAVQGGEDEDDLPPINSVRDAVAAAEARYSDQLVFALNSKSNRDTAFQRPVEVYDALAWLADVYHPIRANPTGNDSDLDILLREACSGWAYVPHQSAVTMGMYPEWYKAEHNGKTYELTQHLRKGTSGNPQYSIRMAFAWDTEMKKVIMGYIGPHQRNQAS